jgi:hypothetical protein
MLDELDEYATRRARVEESHETLGSDSRRLVDELNALPHQAVKRARKVDDLEADVMHRGAPALRQESRDARLGIGRLEKLDAGIALRDEDDLHLLIGHVVHRTDGVPEHVAIEGQRVRDPRHDDADVMERSGAGEAAHRLPGS